MDNEGEMVFLFMGGKERIEDLGEVKSCRLCGAWMVSRAWRMSLSDSCINVAAAASVHRYADQPLVVRDSCLERYVTG